MRNAGLEEAQARIKIARRNSNNFRYANDVTLMAERKEKNLPARKKFTLVNFWLSSYSFYITENVLMRGSICPLSTTIPHSHSLPASGEDPPLIRNVSDKDIHVMMGEVGNSKPLSWNK